MLRCRRTRGASDTARASARRSPRERESTAAREQEPAKAGHRTRPAVHSIHPAPARCYGEQMTDDALLQTLRSFMAEREWEQFHSPENLAKSVAIEAGELLECFQWNADAARDEVADELADVLTYALLLADRLDLNPEQIIRTKLNRTAQKYPVEKARGRSTKYDRL